MLKVYGVPISVHTRKVIMTARFKRIPLEVVPVAPLLPDTVPPDWQHLSPTGKIPVLVDDDFLLGDSAAICAYLERKQPAPALYPEGDRDFAWTLSLEQYAGGTLFRDVVHPLFHQAIVNPRLKKIATDQAQVDIVVQRKIPEVYGYLDSIAGQGFFAGPRVSVADLAVVSNLVTVQYVGYPLDRARYPKLANLVDRTIRLPEVKAALRDEQPAVRQMGLDGAFLDAVLA